MSGETAVQAPPWAGLTWAEYHAQVMALSAYPEAHRQLSAQAGMVAEMGELLSLFDLRRVAKKGPPSRETVRAELGDVLWYAALYSREPGEFERWSEQGGYPAPAFDAVRLAAHHAGGILVVMHALLDGGGSAPGLAHLLCWRFGVVAQEVAFYNLEKLRARQSAGTLHDREARGAGGGV
jgi:NTP pyrophosphatase (non-canonical NTP hydrolase)